MTRVFTHLSRNIKRTIFLLFDAMILPFAFWAAWVLRVENLSPPGIVNAWWVFILIPTIFIPIFVRWGLYQSVIHYMGIKALLSMCYVVSAASLIVGTIICVFSSDVPRSTLFIFWVLTLLFVGGSRIVVMMLFHRLFSGNGSRKRVAVYGAGNAGIQLVKALQMEKDYYPCFFVDDNAKLYGSVIHDMPIYPPEKLPNLIVEYGISLILLAIPSLSWLRRQQLIEYLETLPVHVKMLPGMADIISGEISLSDVKEVEIEDLLGRDPVAPDEYLLSLCITEKSVMVTGAGGSIGTELCRQILIQKPRRLVLYEISEFALYKIERELANHQSSSIEIIPLLGSVLDGRRLMMAMDMFQVQTVYHAAAYKHVPLVELNPIEGVRNNVFGTYYTALAARNARVERFILISTDKAVRPTSIMGASKRAAELILQGLMESSTKTKFIMVRFGNVLDSSGSVVPLFRSQILQGGPITVTHPEVTRYFMTIHEAAQLVIQAGAMGEGGDVFLLDMGDPIRILDMARHMIRLSGLTVRDKSNPSGDIEICYTGLRPGEKLYEELLIRENSTSTTHPRIIRAKEEKLPWPYLEQWLERILGACDMYDYSAVKTILRETVSEYSPQQECKPLSQAKT
ncbi:Polysaccharide biosynthesis protein [Gammaproteobacteria bacterium]